MQRSCPQCSVSFEISDEDLAFYESVSPVFSGKKFSIPPPTLCPDCRLRRRMSFRNERHLYRRPSHLSGKEIISTFASDSPYIVYDQDEWWSDRWDGRDQGRNVDFTQPVSAQLQALNLAVPHPSLNATNVENSEYTNYALNVRNSYLVFGVTNAEDCLYGKFIIGGCKDVVDSLSLFACERCYEGIASLHCYQCCFFSYSQNCNDCWFVEDCLSCKNCLLCFGLRNKEYCIRNVQLNRQEFDAQKQKMLADLTTGKIARLRQEFQEFSMRLPHRGSHIYASEDCTGDMISQSKNCHGCFDIQQCENCKFTAFTPHGIASYDCTFTSPDGVQWCYEAHSSLGQRCMGTYLCWHTNDTYYSIECKSCNSVFGCVGLKNKQHCIFNKQYTEEEYNDLVARLIAHMIATKEWGEYFPVSLSQFAYNETIALEYFPLRKEQALSQGWRWRDTEEVSPSGTSVAPETLPRTIAETTDDVLMLVARSERSGRPFRFVKKELQFYRSLGLPLPHLHPDERHLDRLRRKNPYHLWDRECRKCGRPLVSNYAPDRPEIVYCESCYLDAVY